MERTRLKPVTAFLVVSVVATSILFYKATSAEKRRIYSYAFLLYRPVGVPYSPSFF